MSAGSLAIGIALGFALWAGAAGFAARADVARRALAMCALFAAVAISLAVRALAAADFTMALVARRVVQGDPVLARGFALFSDPGGAALAAALVAAVAVWWFARRPVAGDGAGVGAGAALVVVLLVAPLAGGTLSALPFQPLDGASSARLFGTPAIQVASLALLVLVALATSELMDAFRLWGSGVPLEPSTRRVGVLALPAAALLHAHSWAAGASSTGASRAVDAVSARGGELLALLVVSFVVAGVAVGPRRSALPHALAAALAVLGATMGSGTTAATPAASALLSLALAILVVGAWSPGARVTEAAGVTVAAGAAALLLWLSNAELARAARVAVLIGLVPSALTLIRLTGPAKRQGWALGAGFALGALAALGGIVGTDEAALLAPGKRLAVGRGAVVHQGVSAYDEDRATVLALALEGEPGRTFSRAEQREYVDARGAVLRPVWTAPARFANWGESRWVWLERVRPDDTAEVRLVARPLHGLWWVALLCVALAPLVATARARDSA